MPTLKTSKNILTKNKANGLLEYLFLEKFEPVGLSISLVLATIISGIYISSHKQVEPVTAELPTHQLKGDKYDD